nr:ergothioneine biosynthesis protein EgtB [Oceanococcus sp. HetDA_MAG_MS8]
MFDVPASSQSAVSGIQAEDYNAVRRQSMRLVAELSAEDCALQSMPDVSPAKWHLAHTTWFFETFILLPKLPGYSAFHPQFNYLFNSYYEAVGPRHARPQRGLLSRPSLEQVLEYRRYVDGAMQQWLAQCCADDWPLLRLGLAHEQQHQELMLTDIKHVLAQNPLQPAYAPPADSAPQPSLPAARWLEQGEGLHLIGVSEPDGFCFDNEGPAHRVWLNAYALASRPVSQGEWLEFMADGGYTTANLWLSDGWAWVQAGTRRAPLYWYQDQGEWWQFTLHGAQRVNPDRPVAHLSFYEAAAYALWAGARLPTEAEWEVLAAQILPAGTLPGAPCDSDFESQYVAATASSDWHGGVWEWTASSYAPYPGFRPPSGALGEYNAKFMASQMVLRGASRATPAGHSRVSYRNFFYPALQWQFSGLRLARDI